MVFKFYASALVITAMLVIMQKTAEAKPLNGTELDPKLSMELSSLVLIVLSYFLILILIPISYFTALERNFGHGIQTYSKWTRMCANLHPVSVY